MPASTPRNYVEATRGYGAEVVLVPDIAAAFAEADRLCAAGRVMVHPFDDPLIAAGQGTIGLEILEDLPDVDRVYISIGGGGLIAGIAQVMRTIRSNIRIIGVETNGADAMAKASAAGHPVELPAITSIARTLGAPKVSDFTYRSVKEYVEDVIVVEDGETVKVLFQILERCKYLVEPAAACCLVAAQRHRGSFKPGEKIVILLCGGNVGPHDLVAFAQRLRDRGTVTESQSDAVHIVSHGARTGGESRYGSICFTWSVSTGSTSYVLRPGFSDRSLSVQCAYWLRCAQGERHKFFDRWRTNMKALGLLAMFLLAACNKKSSPSLKSGQAPRTHIRK